MTSRTRIKCYFYFFGHNFVNISTMQSIKISSCREKYHILKTEEILNLALSSVPKEVLKYTFHSPHLALKSPILIGNESLISEDSKAENHF